MKYSDISVGDMVSTDNPLVPEYMVVAMYENHCTLELYTGVKVMWGGKMVDEKFTYNNIKYSTIKEVLTK